MAQHVGEAVFDAAEIVRGSFDVFEPIEQIGDLALDLRQGGRAISGRVSPACAVWV